MEIREITEKLRKNVEYFDYHNKNLTREQDEKINNIKDLIEKLDNFHSYWQVCRDEITCALEDIMNDDLYGEYEDQLEKITEEDINRLAWKLEDMDIWDDIYTYAREMIFEEIEIDEEDD